MPHPNAFLHLPELQGRLTPAHASGLRLTDEALAEWDAQARSQGLPAHWRLPDREVERSRGEVLAAITAHEFDEAGLEAPEWSTNTPPLLVPWCPAHPFLSHDRVQTQTPDWLKRHKIYIPARDLETA